MSAQTQRKLVEYISVTNAAMEKAAAVHDRMEKQAAAIEALLPTCVQALLDNERIEPHQEKQAMQALRDPVKALEILTKVAAHRNDAEKQHLGTGVDQTVTKTASTGTSGSSLRESDQRLWAGLGLPVPKD